jgi:hypothetical protein
MGPIPPPPPPIFTLSYTIVTTQNHLISSPHHHHHHTHTPTPSPPSHRHHPQGARGSDAGAEWFVENIKEELDHPMEFFFEPSSGKLYFVANSTTQAPSGLTFEVPVLQDLIKV